MRRSVENKVPRCKHTGYQNKNCHPELADCELRLKGGLCLTVMPLMASNQDVSGSVQKTAKSFNPKPDRFRNKFGMTKNDPRVGVFSK